MRQLAHQAEFLRAQGVSVAVVGPGSQDDARHLAERVPPTFAVIADPERRVYAAWGLERRWGVIQQSGTAVIDEHGVVRHLTRATGPGHALDLRAVLGAVRSMGRADTHPDPPPGVD